MSLLGYQEDDRSSLNKENKNRYTTMQEEKKLQGVQGESTNPNKVLVRNDLQKQHEGLAK